jgi:hypothetical protein
MQQMMQMMGQMFAAPFSMMADTFSRSVNTFSDWSRGGRGGGSWSSCERRDDWDRCGDGWRDRDRSCDDRDGWRDCDRDRDCGGRDRDRNCGDSWSASSSSGSWCNRCDCSSDRCGCGGGGWKDGDDDCYRRSCRGYDRSSDRVRLVEYSIVSVARGRGDRHSVHGQEVVRDDESKQDFKCRVIADHRHEFPETEQRHLRAFVRELDSWCKESWDYDERKIEVLEEIRDRMPQGAPKHK